VQTQLVDNFDYKNFSNT